MPDVNQYVFKYPELIEMLIKKAGLHEGKWQITMTLGFAGVNIGPTPSEVVPGAAVAVTGIGLQRATAESPEALVLDASIVNPAST